MGQLTIYLYTQHMKRLSVLLTLALVLLLSLTSADTKKPVKIFMIGDSTMANKNLKGNNQERGWGMMMPGFFTDDVIIDIIVARLKGAMDVLGLDGENRLDIVLMQLVKLD